MSSLSVIIITKNEAKNIIPCLESVKFANEIIILDSGSTDNTIALAQKYTQQIYETDWPGFGVQKNRALEKCRCEWILSIDADEVVTPELQHEITAIMQTGSIHNAYALPRSSSYCQKKLAFGDWKNDSCIRLFKKGTAKFKELPVHESIEITGTIGKCRGKLVHDSFSDLEEVINKINNYSTLGARYKYSQGKKSSLLKAITHGAWTFFRGYILRFGFLDGKRGFMLAFSNAEGCYYRYLKLMLLAENCDSSS